MPPAPTATLAATAMKILTTLLTLALVQAASSRPPSPAAREIAPDTYFVPGAMPRDRGPDGNSVIFVAPAGLIAIDTGRHPWHSDAIVAFAKNRRQPIAAVFNTHWHLDHSSGNRRVKAAFPEARVYTTRAVDRALAPGGFLARSIAAARERPPDPKASAVRQEKRRCSSKRWTLPVRCGRMCRWSSQAR